MSDYQLLAAGVLHRPSSRVIRRESSSWVDYEAWLRAGGVPDPMSEPVDPAPLPPTQDQLDSDAARVYAKLVALRGMTPAEVDAWVELNVTNLDTAKDAIKTLAIAISILSRRI